MLFVSDDFYDSPSPVLEIPAGMDLNVKQTEYKAWLKTKERKPPERGYDGYKSFIEWLQDLPLVHDAAIEEFNYD